MCFREMFHLQYCVMIFMFVHMSNWNSSSTQHSSSYSRFRLFVESRNDVFWERLFARYVIFRFNFSHLVSKASIFENWQRLVIKSNHFIYRNIDFWLIFSLHVTIVQQNNYWLSWDELTAEDTEVHGVDTDLGLWSNVWSQNLTELSGLDVGIRYGCSYS